MNPTDQLAAEDEAFENIVTAILQCQKGTARQFFKSAIEKATERREFLEGAKAVGAPDKMEKILKPDSATASEHDRCRKCGRALGWFEPVLCDECRKPDSASTGKPPFGFECECGHDLRLHYTFSDHDECPVAECECTEKRPVSATPSGGGREWHPLIPPSGGGEWTPQTVADIINSIPTKVGGANIHEAISAAHNAALRDIYANDTDLKQAEAEVRQLRNQLRDCGGGEWTVHPVEVKGLVKYFTLMCGSEVIYAGATSEIAINHVAAAHNAALRDCGKKK